MGSSRLAAHAARGSGACVAQRAAAPGFTLIELMVALFVTAVMFALGYGAISQALVNRDSVRQQQQRLSHLQRTVRVLVQDLCRWRPGRSATCSATARRTRCAPTRA